MRLAIAEKMLERLNGAEGLGDIIGKPTLITLADMIGTVFNAEELDALIFSIGANPEDIDGDTMLSRPFHLVSYCGRHGIVERLRKRCQELRPHLDWD